MRFNIKTLLFLLLTVLTVSSLTSISFAQEDGDKELTIKEQSSKSRGGEADENVKQGKPTNDPSMTTERADEKTRASNTKIVVQNYTGWYVDVYNDGYYEGTIGPYQDGYFYDFGDVINLYAKAVFDDGTYIYWGPKYVDNDDYYTYTWQLTY